MEFDFEDTDTDTGKILRTIWDMQDRYNARVKNENSIEESIRPYWTKQYLLGLVSEIDEVLTEVNWKRHRKNKSLENRSNIAFELSDLLKYVMSLWQLWDFSMEEMLEYVHTKSTIMDIQWRMEHAPMPVGQKILLTDIDGTLADWKTSFMIWLEQKDVCPVTSGPTNSLLMDTELNMRYSNYYPLKEEFESTGGYRSLIPYVDAIDLLKRLVNSNVYLIVYTARPAKKYKQIWLDTWLWLKSYDITPDQLIIGHEPRILTADRMRQHNNVAMLEDDPGLMVRAATCGIRVFARTQPYNQEFTHTNIHHMSSYASLTKEEIFD